MARPSKSKRVCRLPIHQEFRTCRAMTGDNQLILSVEEYETIRLIDYLGMTQQECADQMQVGRVTVQMLYTAARKKLARFLVEGTALSIQGGNYELGKEQENSGTKGEREMKIAVTYANGQVFQHFGHTEEFKIYEVEDGKIVSAEVVNTNGQGHGALAGFLKAHGVDTLICGGIGGGARNALAEAGIRLFPGAAGAADEQVASYLAGSLNYDPNTQCHHHGHGEGHTCGSHSCGSHGER